MVPTVRMPKRVCIGVISEQSSASLCTNVRSIRRA
jgi:hypothetical protein